MEPLWEQASFHITSSAFSSVQAALQIHLLAGVLHQALPQQSPRCPWCARFSSCLRLVFQKFLVISYLQNWSREQKLKKNLTAIGTGLRTKIHHKYCSGFSAALQPAQRSSLMCSCTLQSICTLLHLFSHQVTPSQLEDLAGCASSHLWTCLQRFHNPSRQDFNLSPCFKCRLKSWAWPCWRSNFFPSTGTPQWLCILHLPK